MKLKLNRREKKLLYRILISIVLLAPAITVKTDGLLSLALFMLPYLVLGYSTLIKAFKGMCHFQPFDENFLMAVATLGALALGEYGEAVAVMLFYQLGELFESAAVSRSRRSIAQLMDIRPDYANVDDGKGGYTQIDVEEIKPGMELIVLPGERVPVDGTVISGSSSLDCSALTGESLPREVCEGEELISGCINLSSPLRLMADKEYGQSTVARILELVENASSRKSRSESFISRFAAVYTPVVCMSAFALAVIPPLFNILTGGHAAWADWIYRALSFLVISCPCALVISVPLSFFAAIGGAGSAGILIKGSNYIEALSKVDSIAFDKTGTLTKGKFSLSEIKAVGISEAELLMLSAHAECFSKHPISLSIQQAYGMDCRTDIVEDVREIAGKGLVARVSGREIALGNAAMLEAMGIECPDTAAEGTIIYAALEGRYVGYLRIADTLRQNAKIALDRLRALGIRESMLLTGDNEQSGRAVAAELGIDRVYCSLLPQDKLSLVEEELDRKVGGLMAFVGDGINDAPVLGRADVGIAMGALGSDAAIEAADVVLMDDDPAKIAKAVSIARKCMSIVRQNITFAIGVKVICLVLSAFGITGMWLAIFADVGVMVLAVLNSIRAMNVKEM